MSPETEAFPRHLDLCDLRHMEVNRRLETLELAQEKRMEDFKDTLAQLSQLHEKINAVALQIASTNGKFLGAVAAVTALVGVATAIFQHYVLKG